MHCKAEGDLVILFGDAVKGDAVRQLVAFGDSLGIPVKYVCLVDYSNSRGAVDMGLLPDLLPGYQPAPQPGLAYSEILASPDLEVLWVVGANPLKDHALAAAGAFVVVQDLFMTETARRADIVLPGASAYEKNGTVTNVCGRSAAPEGRSEGDGHEAGSRNHGPDGERDGPESGDLETGESARRDPQDSARIQRAASDAHYRRSRADHAGERPRSRSVPAGADPDRRSDTLFTSGTLGRYSKTLGAVLESPGGLCTRA